MDYLYISKWMSHPCTTLVYIQMPNTLLSVQMQAREQDASLVSARHDDLIMVTGTVM